MARPRGANQAAALVLRNLHKRLQAGWKPGLTLLTGEDLYHLDAAQRALIDALVPKDAADLALTVYGDQNADLATVVAAARSVGMFSSRRVVLVRDAAVLTGEPDALAAYARKPPPDSYLVVRAPKLDRRRKLDQTLVRCAEVLEFAVVEPHRASSLAGEVASLARGKELQIDRSAASLLAELCAGDFYRIESELEKMRAWLGGTGRVDLAVIREVAAGSELLSGWELAGAIGRRDRRAALAAIRRLIDAGDEPLRILGGVAFRARAMMQAKAMIARGLGPPQAMRAARLFGDDPRRMAEGLTRYSGAELLRFPAHLLEADRTLKSRSLGARAVLEALVDRMIPQQAEEGP